MRTLPARIISLHCDREPNPWDWRNRSRFMPCQKNGLVCNEAILISISPSDIDISCRKSIGFNKIPSWFDEFAHQHGENLVSRNGILNLNTE